jgi:hypothetical protein
VDLHGVVVVVVMEVTLLQPRNAPTVVGHRGGRRSHRHRGRPARLTDRPSRWLRRLTWPSTERVPRLLCEMTHHSNSFGQ